MVVELLIELILINGYISGSIPNQIQLVELRSHSCQLERLFKQIVIRIWPIRYSKDRIWLKQQYLDIDSFFYRVDCMRQAWKIGTYLLAAALLFSLQPQKRYERKHSPVGASSGQKSSDKAKEKSSQEEAKSDEHDKEAIGTCQRPSGYLFDYWK